eukprot:306381-Chlamydomonas_euryale.AAC.3
MQGEGRAARRRGSQPADLCVLLECGVRKALPSLGPSRHTSAARDGPHAPVGRAHRAVVHPRGARARTSRTGSRRDGKAPVESRCRWAAGRGRGPWRPGRHDARRRHATEHRHAGAPPPPPPSPLPGPHWRLRGNRGRRRSSRSCSCCATIASERACLALA